MPQPPDIRIARRAATQHRNITHAQLAALGVDDKAIARRVARGWLHRVYMAVYSVGTPARTALERAAAAVLACGPGAALSHFSALALWGFAKRWPAIFEVTVPHGDRRHPGLKIHRSRTLTRRDVTVHLGIRTTTPARTLLDCAPALAPRQLTRIVNDALHTPWLTRRKLAEVCERNPLHPGAKLLIPFYDTTDGPSRTDWEDEFPAFCLEHDLPRPLMNHRLGKYTADAYFPAERVIVELDGWGSHSGRDRFESDRERDAANLAEDRVTVRVTKRRLQHAAEREAERLRKILELRRRRA